MAAPKEIILLNQSRRLYVIAGVKLSPTAALAFPAEVAEYPGVKSAIAEGDLAIGDEVKEPIIDKKDAEKDSARRKAEAGPAGRGRARGNAVPRAAQQSEE